MELSSYDLERQRREEAFDERITKLQAELAERPIYVPHTTADELHPNVHNLPHESIQSLIVGVPDVEVSE
jgi:hypothetical protein